MVADLKKQLEKKTGKKVFPISAPIGMGIEDLQNEMLKYLPVAEEIVEEESVVIDLANKKDPNDFVVTHEGEHAYRVTGVRIEQIVRMTPLKYLEAVDRVWDVMTKRKILNEILRQVVKNSPPEDAETYKNLRDLSHIWYSVEGKILIGEAVFNFRDFR
jgi:predicted GTPase